MTPMGSRSPLMSGDGGYRLRPLSPAERPQRVGDGQHLLVGQRAKQGVRDPVRAAARAPRDELDAASVVEQLVLAAVDGLAPGRVVEDRRRAPVGALDAVVLADAASVGDEPVGPMALAGAVD